MRNAGVHKLGMVLVASVFMLALLRGSVLVADASHDRMRPVSVYVAVDDTFVADWSGSTPDLFKNDQERFLIAEKKDVPPLRYVIYIRFGWISPSPPRFNGRARLRMRTVVACDPTPFEPNAAYGVHVVAESWRGSELDGSRLPAYSPAVDLQYPQEQVLGTWIEWDVTEAIRNQWDRLRDNGFAVAVDDVRVGHSFCQFDSSETRFAPHVRIDGSTQLFLPVAAVERGE